jgi:altronate dehydratase large subunit
MEIQGYLREDGSAGIRNHLLIIPASVCAATVASRIAEQVEGAVYLPNQHGCAQIKPDLDICFRTLAGFGKNPNVGAVLVIGLGCESLEAETLAQEIAMSGKPVEYLVIQKCGGTLATQARGLRTARQMSEKISGQGKTHFDISWLTIGLECGGSDTTSGLAANPVQGAVSDIHINNGGTSILSETTELIGAEHVLARRGVSEKVGQDLLNIVRACEKRAMRMGVDLRGSQPTPGNIDGGLTTIEEKSLGCIYKAGSSPLQGVLDYAQSPTGKGLFMMDTPGQDIESITGMVAGGAQLVLFTTGRGTPTGCPIAPVIKLTGNPATYTTMEENIDLNAGNIILGDETIKECAERLYSLVLEVCNGKFTKAESLRHREFGIYKLTSTF